MENARRELELEYQRKMRAMERKGAELAEQEAAAKQQVQSQLEAAQSDLAKARADVLSASANDDTIAWYENADGVGGSWTRHVISTLAGYALWVFAIAVDGDRPISVLSPTR